MAQLVRPVILCGGSGTRLWPLSRAEFPKQFLSLFGQESLFQLAVERLVGLAGDDILLAPSLVVGNEEHRFIILDQLKDSNFSDCSIVLEPIGRNTAPALALAAHAAMKDGDDPIMVVCPADHMVLDGEAFVDALKRAVSQAADGAIVTLGIRPDRPETGYGYIHAEGNTVKAFVEKPDKETARRYVDEGCYYWNGGIFIQKASVLLKALDTFRPDIATAVERAWKGHTVDSAFIRPDSQLFADVPAESIDYAVMEKCPASDIPMRIVPLAAGWSDLGSWDAAWETAKKDGGGNAQVGDVMIKDSTNVLVHATSRLVSVVGVENIVVIETPDAVLVADRSRSQDVRKIVSELGNSARGEHTQHRKVYRPWGWYDSVDEGAGFKVKRIMVKPGASLSLQKHAHRAEHWVVVSGVAEVTCSEKTSQLQANESTYIPKGEIHRLRNPGEQPLEIIEVQSGSYLGEDDIVRLEDQYGRKHEVS